MTTPSLPRRGIVSYGAYVPWWRLSREAIGAAHGASAGAGTRAVASYDEDTTSMGVEAARAALRPLGEDGWSFPRSLWFATTAPSYADKTNANTIHAALRLDRGCGAYDAVGAVRSGNAALEAAMAGPSPALVVAADMRTGLPNSPDEREGGDGAVALLFANDHHTRPVIAEHLGSAHATEEFVDRWRTPGDRSSKTWEERFGETRYVPLGVEAWKDALGRCLLNDDDVDLVIVTGTHPRAVKQVAKAIGRPAADDLASTVGNTGTAQAGLALANALDTAAPNTVIGVVSLADGADVFLFRTTEAIASYQPVRTVADQVATGNDSLPYLKFLSWKQMVTVQPPNRPEPARVSSSAAARHPEWKYALTPFADATGTIVTFTVDRLAYSPSPPIVFAVVDFDERDTDARGDEHGSDRMPIELTDVVAEEVQIGDRVEMTFRRLNQADGIQNYFWKAKPAR